MGLDMYLTREVYIGDKWEAEEKRHVKAVCPKERAGDFKADTFNGRIGAIEYDVAYWRKANHIHKWFVDHVQEGKDDCERYFVEAEQLKALVKTCENVLKNRKKAPEILPTAEGFFFGGTGYDSCYFEDCKNTIEMINAELATEKDGYYYYQSSW